MRYPLLVDEAEDVTGDVVLWPGGDGELRVGGDLDGGSVSLEYTFAGEWSPVSSETTVSAASIVALSLSRGRYRAVLSGVGAAASVSAELRDKVR